jgi:ABC-type multidrug transport system fused ATPase/permease subunit
MIAVVPQDPTLFNDTIMYNVKYARLNATDEEVYEACKSAVIHENIMSFSNDQSHKGYQTKVGKKGM